MSEQDSFRSDQTGDTGCARSDHRPSRGRAEAAGKALYIPHARFKHTPLPNQRRRLPLRIRRVDRGPRGNARDAQRPEFAVGLRYKHSSDWLWPVGLLPESKRQFSQPPLDPVCLDVRKVLAVDPRRPLVGAALGIGMRQNVLAADLVVQGVEAIAGFRLRFRVTPSAASERFSELLGCPISRSLTTSWVGLELRPLPSAGITRLHR